MTFECADLVFALGSNRLLFQRKAAASAQPDCFLVVLSADQFGIFDCFARDWKADSVQAVAVSQSGTSEEAMLLMKPFDWVRTALGRWQLRTGSIPERTRLELVEDGTIG